jgi:hypothetical protein
MFFNDGTLRRRVRDFGECGAEPFRVEFGGQDRHAEPRRGLDQHGGVGERLLLSRYGGRKPRLLVDHEQQ